MGGFKNFYSALLMSLLLVAFIHLANTSILPNDSNQFGICIRNCAQCKKMFGAYFEGQLCADACVKFKGKVIPDCEDLDSISPFLNKEPEPAIRLKTEERKRQIGNTNLSSELNAELCENNNKRQEVALARIFTPPKKKEHFK
ncbi:hypothetical protein RUM44_009311 [Polyplax serrata]|uniref:Eclosion hormone n=1 Tax=Polyplax serrata TaxID=468196 RepID=A0ABR1ASC1_POLSC